MTHCSCKKTRGTVAAWLSMSAFPLLAYRTYEGTVQICLCICLFYLFLYFPFSGQENLYFLSYKHTHTQCQVWCILVNVLKPHLWSLQFKHRHPSALLIKMVVEIFIGADAAEAHYYNSCKNWSKLHFFEAEPKSWWPCNAYLIYLFSFVFCTNNQWVQLCCVV